MTRSEFGDLLQQVKSNAHVKLIDSIPYIRKLSGKKMEAMENGMCNYSLLDAMLYIRMCGATLVLECGYYSETLKELCLNIKSICEYWGMAPDTLARQANISVSMVASIFEGSCNLKIDTFLKIADVLRLTVEIE